MMFRLWLIYHGLYGSESRARVILHCASTTVAEGGEQLPDRGAAGSCAAPSLRMRLPPALFATECNEKHSPMNTKTPFLCIAGLIFLQPAGSAPIRNSPICEGATAEHVVGPCRFTIANMYGGEFKVSGRDGSPPQGVYYLPETGPMAFLDGAFGLSCHDANHEQIATALNGKYVDGRWLRYGPVNGPEFVPYERLANARTIPLHGRNWTGMAYVEDDTTGDERRRARVFHFCLIHDARALCGDTVIKWLADRKKREDLDRIKAILESVEFVDSPAPPPVGAVPPHSDLRQYK